MPRSMRVKGYGASSLAPVAAAMLPAVASPLPKSALPAISRQVLRPERSMAAACSTVSIAGRGALGTAGILAIKSFLLGITLDQETSPGTISVAMRPGAVRAAMIASAASRATSDAAQDVRSHLE